MGCKGVSGGKRRVEEGGFGSVKRAREMEDDENRSIPPSYCSHVAWGYQAVNIKTNYRTGNFTDREDLSPSGAFSLPLSGILHCFYGQL